VVGVVDQYRLTRWWGYGVQHRGVGRGQAGLPQFVGIFGVRGGYLAWSEA
jgi:hypothetical protein